MSIKAKIMYLKNSENLSSQINQCKQLLKKENPGAIVALWGLQPEKYRIGENGCEPESFMGTFLMII